MRLDRIIHKPIITEKTVDLTGGNMYVFKVDKKAGKSEISNAVSRLFDVDVLSVRTMIIPGKKRKIKGTFRFIRSPSWKKAEVQIKGGQKIDLFEKLIGGKSGN